MGRRRCDAAAAHRDAARDADSDNVEPSMREIE
jgi:hypothetical protein